MLRLFCFFPIAWRMWRTHGTRIFFCLLWYYLKAKLTGEWEPWLWTCVPREGCLALDVGANTGQWSLKLATRFQEVIAIEPHPGSARQLRDRAPFNIRVVEGAAWDRPMWKTLILYPDLRICRISDHDFLYSMGQGKNGIEVACFPLDALKLDNVDFIKFDVEGAEVEAVRGSRETLERCHPTLLIELHKAEAREWLVKTLPLLGYSLEYIHYPFYRPNEKLYDQRLWLVAKFAKYRKEPLAFSTMG